jgi:hypothetical protein
MRGDSFVAKVFGRLDAAGRRAILLFVDGVVCGASMYVMFRSEHTPVIFLSGIVVGVSLFIFRREIRWFYGLSRSCLHYLFSTTARGKVAAISVPILAPRSANSNSTLSSSKCSAPSTF